MPWPANFNETRVWNYTEVVYFNSRAVTLIDGINHLQLILASAYNIAADGKRRIKR